MVCAELEDLKCGTAELHQILNTAARQTVKEVIFTKINIFSAKIASLNESVEEEKINRHRNKVAKSSGWKKKKLNL